MGMRKGDAYGDEKNEKGGGQSNGRDERKLPACAAKGSQILGEKPA